MKTATLDEELDSLKAVLHALEPLDDTQRRFVLKTVAERMDVAMATSPSAGSGKEQAHPQVGAHPGGSAARAGGSDDSSGSGKILDGQTSKQFLKSKAPTTDVQRITCLAYYLTHARGQAQFKTGDLIKLNVDAGGSTMSNPSMTVGNATSLSKYLAAVGNGKKQVTSLGEDVVDALPSQEAVKSVLASRRKPRKRRTKKVATKTK
jgi:hypothetical protein